MNMMTSALLKCFSYANANELMLRRLMCVSVGDNMDYICMAHTFDN